MEDTNFLGLRRPGVGAGASSLRSPKEFRVLGWGYKWGVKNKTKWARGGVDTDQGTFDMDQGIWVGLNHFEHSMHPALGLSLSSSTIEVLVEVLSFDYVNKYLFWIDM